MTDDNLDKLDESVGLRILAITVNNDGVAEVETDGFSAWELIGLGAWLEMTGHELLQEGPDEED